MTDRYVLQMPNRVGELATAARVGQASRGTRVEMRRWVRRRIRSEWATTRAGSIVVTPTSTRRRARVAASSSPVWDASPLDPWW